MKRVFYLYNPFSGNQGNGKNLDGVIGALMEAGIQVSVHRLYTMTPDTALEDFFLSHQGEYDAILTAGGDGTLSHVLNIAQKYGCRLPMGFLPTGTCNDLVRSLGLPKDPKKCLRIFIDGLLSRQYRQMDLGKITAGEGAQAEPFYFLNSLAGGMFVNISYQTSSELKKVFGPLAYFMTALRDLSLKPFRLRIETEERIFDDSVLLFLMLNGSDVAGMSRVIDHADMQDGKMDLLLIRDGSFFATLQAGLQLTRAQKNAKSFEWIRCEHCTLTADPAPYVSIDGEKSITSMPYRVEVLHRALLLPMGEVGRAPLLPSGNGCEV